MASETKPVDLISFCKTVIKDMSSTSVSLSSDKCLQIAENLFEKKCSKLLSEIDSKNIHSLPESEKCKCLQTIAQFILDLTYIDECLLVDEEFPRVSSTYTRLNFIIDTLSSIESLAQELVQQKSLLEIFGSEISECLHWRKGALLYMYCHSLNSAPDLNYFPDHYQKCLENGVQYLKCMLCTRTKPDWLRQLDGEIQAEDKEEDDDTFLLSEGVYSDIHLLALMYCGEMCYWLIQHQTNCADKVHHTETHSTTPSTTSSSADAQTSNHEILQFGLKENESNFTLFKLTGLACLKVYIKSASGPLSLGGWNTNRAVEIVDYLSSH